MLHWLLYYYIWLVDTVWSTNYAHLVLTVHLVYIYVKLDANIKKFGENLKVRYMESITCSLGYTHVNFQILPVFSCLCIRRKKCMSFSICEILIYWIFVTIKLTHLCTSSGVSLLWISTTLSRVKSVLEWKITLFPLEVAGDLKNFP